MPFGIPVGDIGIFLELIGFALLLVEVLKWIGRRNEKIESGTVKGPRGDVSFFSTTYKIISPDGVKTIGISLVITGLIIQMELFQTIFNIE